jgi:light-regulated signal transduction histidine kinase (bacteriophytochrome)
VYGKSISILDDGAQLENMLISSLQRGYFSEEEVLIRKKWTGKLRYSISGFCLGMLTDFDGLIVLRFINKDEVNELSRELQQTKTQLDNFIYRTAHDIRGPLATIQGLVNLLRMRTDDNDVDRFIDLIDSHAQTLDERLYQLVYLAQADEGNNQPKYVIDFNALETNLRRVIEKNAFVDFLEMHFNGPQETVRGINEDLLGAMLNNLLQYLLSLPQTSVNDHIFCHLEIRSQALNISLRGLGFRVDQGIQKVIMDEGVSIYTDLLQYSKFVHFFAAQKIAWKLKASIHVEFPAVDSVQFNIQIPINRE